MLVIQELYHFFKKHLQLHFTLEEIDHFWRSIKEDILMEKWNFQPDESLYKQYEEQIYQITKALIKGQPLQHITTFEYFYGYRFRTDARALIPRPETEELTHWVLQDLAEYPDPFLRIVDIGTGTGCIPVVIKKKAPEHELTGIDISPDALELARVNASMHGAPIQFLEADILNWKDTSLSQENWDIIVSNPPYIPYKERHLMSEPVILHEPEVALFVPDEDPLLFYRTILEYGVNHLNRLGRS